MHKEQADKTGKDKGVCNPPHEVFCQKSFLEQYIGEKCGDYLDEFTTEECCKQTFNCGTAPFGDRQLLFRLANPLVEPVI